MFDQLIQVEAEQLKHQAQVVLVDEEVLHPDEVMLVFRVADLVQELQDAHFDTSLVVEGCLILDDLNSHNLPSLLAYALGHLPKGTLPKHVTDNVPEHTR